MATSPYRMGWPINPPNGRASWHLNKTNTCDTHFHLNVSLGDKSTLIDSAIDEFFFFFLKLAIDEIEKRLMIKY